MGIPSPTQDDSRPRHLSSARTASRIRAAGSRISLGARSLLGRLFDGPDGRRGNRGPAPTRAESRTQQQRLDARLARWLDGVGDVASAQWYGSMLPTTASPHLRATAARLIETGSPMARATVWLLAPEIAGLVDDPGAGLRDRDAVVRYRVLQEIPLACVSAALGSQLLEDPDEAVQRLAEKRIRRG